MCRTYGQKRKQTTEHSNVLSLQDTFDKKTYMHVAIRYQDKYAYVLKHVFHLVAMIDKVLPRLWQKFFIDWYRVGLA